MHKSDCDIIRMPIEIEAAMDNWERWAKGRTTFRNRCLSLESRYRSTDVHSGHAPIVEIDLLSALEVERIISRYLPQKYRKAIKAYHIQRLPEDIMQRRLGERDIGCLMLNAWAMIYNLLKTGRTLA